MARGLNKVMIISNLGRDPEMRFTPSGSPVTNFTVAVNRNRKGPTATRSRRPSGSVVAWDKLAEISDKYLRKGNTVYVEGRLQSRKYTDKDGIERTTVEIVATDMNMLGGRAEGADLDGGMGGQSYSGGGRQQAQPQRAARQNSAIDEDSDIDDVPF